MYRTQYYVPRSFGLDRFYFIHQLGKSNLDQTNVGCQESGYRSIILFAKVMVLLLGVENYTAFV